MPDLPASDETPADSTEPADPQAVQPGENAYAKAFDQARQMATSFRQSVAEQQGNAVG